MPKPQQLYNVFKNLTLLDVSLMCNHAYVHDLHDTPYISPANTNTYASIAHSTQPQNIQIHL
jgi:hypothetical protein